MSSRATPSTSELLEGLSFYPIALVVSATIFPGFTICIPALLFVTVLILLPILALAIVLLAAGAIVAAPVLLVRTVRRRLAQPREAVQWGEARGVPA